MSPSNEIVVQNEPFLKAGSLAPNQSAVDHNGYVHTVHDNEFYGSILTAIPGLAMIGTTAFGIGNLIADSVILGGGLLAGGFIVGGGAFSFGIKLFRKSSRAAKIAKKVEFERVKALLIANFGENAGVSDFNVEWSMLSVNHKNHHSWHYNDEKFTVTYSQESGFYSFYRVDAPLGKIKPPAVTATAGKPTVFQEELKPLAESLKATDVAGEPSLVLNRLLGSVSKLVQTELAVERQHEVKRLLIDATELVRISSSLAVYDEAASEKKLSFGLNALAADADALIESERELLSHQLDSYNNYVEVRSISV